MQGIRAHLERQEPLSLELAVQVAGGHMEVWQVTGSAERTTAGQPMCLAGAMRVVGADRTPGAAGKES